MAIAFVFSGISGFSGWLYGWPFTARQTCGPNADAGPRQRLSLATWLTTPKKRETWGIVIGRSLTDPVWWFFVFWLPQYLSDARGFSLKQIAAFAWIPFIAADIGNFAGGFASGALIKRGMPVLRARKMVCVISCIPMLGGIPAASVSQPVLGFGTDLLCAARICQLVDDGPDVSVRSVSHREW